MQNRRPFPSDEIEKGALVRTLEKSKLLVSLVARVRNQKMITRLHRYWYNRNHRKIEIDITYRCNMKCSDCNRSCTQAPSREQMTIDQIEKFVQESIDNKSGWTSIMVIGGEPALHPDLYAILQLLLAYKKHHSPEASIILATNGAGNKVKSVLRTIPDGVSLRNTEKDVLTFNHLPFNEAPQDSLLYKLADYSYACPLTYHCGTGLTPYGYYLCPIAGGGIDRILGLDLGRKKMPDPSDQLEEQRLAFCRLCGHFKVGKLFKKNGVSVSWRKAYRLYQNQKPVLTLY